MKRLIEQLADLETWDMTDVQSFLQSEIDERKKMKVFKEVSPIISDFVMDGKNRSDMNEQENILFKLLCEKVCGYLHEDKPAKLDYKNKSVIEECLTQHKVPQVYKDRIFQKLGLN